MDFWLCKCSPYTANRRLYCRKVYHTPLIYTVQFVTWALLYMAKLGISWLFILRQKMSSIQTKLKKQPLLSEHNFVWDAYNVPLLIQTNLTALTLLNSNYMLTSNFLFILGSLHHIYLLLWTMMKRVTFLSMQKPLRGCKMLLKARCCLCLV
jgi:hypothetical protein